MASNNTAATAPSSAGNQTNNVSLRVVALAHATNQNEDLYLVTDLNTSITQLKERLQHDLSDHPPPANQRLIYQGRPLTDGNATLRSILRLDTAGSITPPVHVLHLVVRDAQSNMQSSTNSPQPQPTQAQAPGLPAAGSQPPGPVPALPPGLDFMQQAFPPGHPANTAIQNIMQQHMASVNALHQQHQRMHHNQHAQLHQGQQHQHPEPVQQSQGNQMHSPHPHPNSQPNILNGHLPTFAIPPFNMPPPIARTQGGDAPTPQVPSSQPNAQFLSTTLGSRQEEPTGTDPSGIPPNLVQGNYSMTIQEVHGPGGERTRTIVRNGPMLSPQTDPIERSASAPHPAVRPADATNQLQQQSQLPFSFRTIPQQPTPAITNHTIPFPRFPAMPILQPSVAGPSARNPTLYLVSSPTGPEALLITPNHGYFSSTQQTNPVAQATTHTNTNLNEAISSAQQSIPTPTQPLQRDRSQQRNDQAQVALRPQHAAPGEQQAQAQAQPARREGEDLVALLLQRGWLFVRLYMFIFVLSEPGTWRRYILLIIASLGCLLPRNNPFTDLFRAARGHFDNLIGPAQPAALVQRPQNNGQQPTRDDANNTTGSNAPNPSNSAAQNAADASMPTPEQNARRLIQEHQQRNPNVIRETMYRIEQGVALFLASLIPGVGERHVRAREEARRIEQEEDQRRRREDEASAQQQIQESDRSKTAEVTASSSSLPADHDASTAVATGVDATGTAQSSSQTTGEGIRMRDTNPNGPSGSI